MKEELKGDWIQRRRRGWRGKRKSGHLKTSTFMEITDKSQHGHGHGHGQVIHVKLSSESIDKRNIKSGHSHEKVKHLQFGEMVIKG